MNRYTLNETFVVNQYAIDEWEAEPHNHNYFEIIFIEKGNGYHTINDIRFPYKENNIFLLAPEDTHHFEIEKRTNFTYFKFTELLFSSKVIFLTGNIGYNVLSNYYTNPILYQEM